jgi:hypothetical protein
MKSNMVIFNILSVREGGIEQNHALRLLQGAGIEAFRATSAYMGHTAIGVKTLNRRTLRRVGNLLYS